MSLYRLDPRDTAKPSDQLFSAPAVGSGWGVAIEIGTKVKLRPERFTYSRPHLLLHARQGDVGEVTPPSRQSPSMARLYIIVRFDGCDRSHRVLEEELETVA